MPPRSTISVSPAPTPKDQYGKLADALYQWCVDNHETGEVVHQEELLNCNIIPNRDVNILLGAANHLIRTRLFKTHDVKGFTGVAWELVSEEHAANYDDLSRDEQMVYSYVESAAAAGIWTKTIKAKTQLHPKVVEKSLKHLETKGLIKPMKNVKNPGRKMYILSRLKPNEDATGGSWYTNDELDVALLENVANAIEGYVSLQSWEKIDITEPIEPRTGQKRKAPSSGFDIKGKGKARANSMTIHDDDAPRPPRKLKPRTEFRSHPPGYDGYPTVHDVTKAMNDQRVVTTILPVNAISQLVEVMVLDDKLVKRYRLPIPGNITEEQEAEDSGNNQVAMYRHLKKPDQAMHDYRRRNNAAMGDLKAAREIELEDIGLGGSTEVPCLRCPVFDICEDGGPVNAKTCTYWDEFWRQMEKADKEGEGEAIYDIDETEV